MIELLVMAGSIRKGSYNQQLAMICTDLLSQKADVKATRIDLRDYSMPIYDGDIEADHGLPEAAQRLKALFSEADGFLLCAPEYNSSLAPLLKNALDWISRPEDSDSHVLQAFTGKVAALTAASPGRLGGLRGLLPLRMMLSNIGVHVCPTQFALSAAHEAFSSDGQLAADQLKPLHAVIDGLVSTALKLR